MVDFAKMHADWYAGLDDEARARVDAARAKEARAEATAMEVDATFQRFGTHDGGKTSFVAKTWTAPVKMRIEERDHADGSKSEILAFVGAVTGHERYSLDESLASILMDPEERRARPDWYVCAGSLKYESCCVKTEAVEAYVRKMRPHLFEQVPAPAM